MRHTSAKAALLAVAALGGTVALTTPASATAASPARAAWIKSCAIDDYSTEPCGHWRLMLRDGRTVIVAGAATTRVDRSGAKSGTEGLFAISADGRWIAYERAGDHRLVVRRSAGGAVTVLPKAALPRGGSTLSADLTLSPRGDKVLVDFTDEDAGEPARVVTVATGAITRINAKEVAQGFSADGDEVLTTRYRSDNTTELISHRLGDGGVFRRVPPQVVANAIGFALAADGKTVAAVVEGYPDTGAKPRVRVYDLETGALSAGVTLALGPAYTPYAARWTGDGRLTAVVSPGEEGKSVVARVLTTDVETGAVTYQDRFILNKQRYTYTVAGG
ncbi:hypothetical protein OIE66_13120 [Nonomuraea sp. NBC_01738]|uniref:TolB family protein n=1 Tax=Nonomuraea sp. NBC_01738 TaxID=2976003 RepID=UPI002E0DF430|nr:hypothetical protein OIE66_13120 [Nonomuraea sp. NBC_01738]